MAAETATGTIVLEEVPLFRGLGRDELGRIRGLLHARSFPAGASVFTAEQPGDAAFVIRAGAVKVQVDRADGEVAILAVLGPGEVVGEMSLVDRLGRSATVVTLEPSELLGMNRTAFWECLRTMPAMTFNLVEGLSRRLRLANANVEALATLDVEGRLAAQLLALAEAYGEPDAGGARRIPFRLTQSDLADLVGASRVRVNQVLVELKRRGAIAVDDLHRISVLDPAALARECA